MTPDPVTVPGVARPWLAMAVLGGAVFVVVFDSLSVATALPAIGADLGIGVSGLQWVVNSYSLAIGGLLLLGGRSADIWGRRRMLALSLLLLTVGTLLAGLAPGPVTLLAARALQGISAAFALPASLALTGSLFPTEPWRGRGFTAVAVLGGVAALAGAIIGGLLTAAFGWRWIFLAAVPLMALIAGGAWRVLPPDDVYRRARQQLDVAGAVLATAGLVLVFLGLGRVGQSSPAALDVVAPAAAGALMLMAFVVLERRRRIPLIQPRLLRSRRLRTGSIGIAAHSAVYSAIVVVGSLHLQRLLHLSAAEAGLALCPALLAATLSGPIGGRLVRAIGARWVAAAGLGLNTVAMAMLALQAHNTNYSTGVLPWLLLQGFSGGWNYLSLTQAALGGSDGADRGARSGIFEAATHIGGAIAVASYLTAIGDTSDYRGAYTLAALFALTGCLAVLFRMPTPVTLRAAVRRKQREKASV